jgi:hypothetical protein
MEAKERFGSVRQDRRHPANPAKVFIADASMVISAGDVVTWYAEEIDIFAELPQHRGEDFHSRRRTATVLVHLRGTPGGTAPFEPTLDFEPTVNRRTDRLEKSALIEPTYLTEGKESFRQPVGDHEFGHDRHECMCRANRLAVGS